MLQQLQYENALAYLDTIFESFGILYMPIKGAYLICTGIASALPQRFMVDIDLLVHRKDFHPVIELMRGHPLFTMCTPDPWTFEQAFDFRNGVHNTRLEMHCKLNREERFLLDTGALFERGIPQTAVRILPSPEDALVILLCHALVHSGFGFPESLYCEVRVLSTQPGFSWERCLPLIRSTGIEPFCYALLRDAAAGGVSYIPKLSRHKWADYLYKTIPDRKKLSTVHQLLFRGLVEPLFARAPVTLAMGWMKRMFWEKTTRSLKG